MNDQETSMYYLQSRYYNPKTGRFLNADALASTGQDLTGNNMYAYCGNNPVMYADSTGLASYSIENFTKESIKGRATAYRLALKIIEKVASKYDITWSGGLNISGSPGAFIGSFQGGTAIDTKGNVALQGSYAGGVTTSAGAAITGYITRTNAPNIDALEGLGAQLGGSVGAPVFGVPIVLGADVNIIPDPGKKKVYTGSTGNIGFGFPGAEAHVEWGETATLGGARINIFDIADQLYNRIMGW